MCDDNPEFCGQIEKLLGTYFDKKGMNLPEIVSFYSGKDLLCDTGEKDIVFLDIEMPGINGISVGEELMRRDKKTIIMIVTSYGDYLDDAMRFHVYRYLSKPIDESRFMRNMDDALCTYQSNLLARTPIITPEGTYLCDMEDIIMVETVGRKLVFYTTHGELSQYGSLEKWMDVLNAEMFYRCHRSTIVNLLHVTGIENDRVILDGGKFEGYVTKRKHRALKGAWLQFLERQGEM